MYLPIFFYTVDYFTRISNFKIARALASERQLLLADEPTGNLDEEMAKEITLILKESAHTHGKCVIVVTHSLELASEADIVISLKNGKLVNKQRE